MVARSALALVSVLALGAAAAPGPRDWATYGGDLQSTNDSRAGWTATQASTATERWVRTLDGVIYGPPLVAQVGSARRLFVVTEADSVYSLDAQSGRVVWRHSFGPPVQTPCSQPYGITSAPALDPSHGRLYVVGARGTLVALSLRSGAPVPGWSVRITQRIDAEYVWSSLRLIGNRIYAAVASYCDKPGKDGRYADGRLLAVDVQMRRIVDRFDLVPGAANMGGAWGWGGYSVDPATHTLYTATGNAQVERHGDLIETAGDAERVLELTPSLRVLHVSSVQPRAPDNLGDEDFGATPSLFTPKGCPPLAAANGKNGRLSVWQRRVLGRALWSALYGGTDPDSPFLGQPAWDAARGQMVVSQAQFGSTSDPSHGVIALRPGSGCRRWSLAWAVDIGGGSQPPPLVLGDVVIATTPAGDAYAISAAKGSIVWSAKPGPTVAPVATDGRAIFVAGLDGRVHAYAPRGFTAP